MSAKVTFNPQDVEWGHTGSDREQITLQLDANLKPTHITEGNQTLSHGFMDINQLLVLSSSTARTGVLLHVSLVVFPLCKGEIPFLALVLLHVFIFPG